jgi:hypothetical protein
LIYRAERVDLCLIGHRRVSLKVPSWRRRMLHVVGRPNSKLTDAMHMNDRSVLWKLDTEKPTSETAQL